MGSHLFSADPSLERKWFSLVGPKGTPLSHIINVLNFEKRELCDGYTPFSKHVFMENEWGEMRALAMPITDENRHKLHSGYTQRYPNELKWLNRWFKRSEVGEPPAAEFLDVEVYSREQLAMEDGKPVESYPTPWVVIGVKGTLTKESIPNLPMTMVNNALGPAFGGSGAPLNLVAYAKAAEFWDAYAIVKPE